MVHSLKRLLRTFLFDRYTTSIIMWKTDLSKVSSSLKSYDPDYNNEHFEKLLQPLDDLSSEPESDVSDLTDIFEEFHRSSFLRANADPSKKYLTKIEADWKTVESFTGDFKKTMKETREELGIDDSMFDEEKAINEILDSKHSVNKALPTIDKDSITIKKQNVRKASNISEDSTTWQMLLANSDSSFEVAHPSSQFFGREKEHWLQRPNISWKQVDESRLKCESWFESQ